VNIDELREQIERDELEDKHATVTHMSVSEYAKAIGEQPQLVHYYIRTGKIKKAPCECCGRSVIEVAEADKVFAEARAKRNQ
jgi:hypothetical protein